MFKLACTHTTAVIGWLVKVINAAKSVPRRNVHFLKFYVILFKSLNLLCC